MWINIYIIFFLFFCETKTDNLNPLWCSSIHCTDYCATPLRQPFPNGMLTPVKARRMKGASSQKFQTIFNLHQQSSCDRELLFGRLVCLRCCRAGAQEQDETYQLTADGCQRDERYRSAIRSPMSSLSHAVTQEPLSNILSCPSDATGQEKKNLIIERNAGWLRHLCWSFHLHSMTHTNGKSHSHRVACLKSRLAGMAHEHSFITQFTESFNVQSKFHDGR